MDTVNVTILNIGGDRYATGGFELVNMNSDQDKALRTPKLLPGEVLTVPVGHWLADPAMSKRMMVTDLQATRPYSFVNVDEAKTYQSQINRKWRPRCTAEIIQESVDTLVEEMKAGKGKLVVGPQKGARRAVTNMGGTVPDFGGANPNNSMAAPEGKTRGGRRRA